MLELRDARKHYRPAGAGAAGEVRAVDGVSLTVASGELVALLGPSGSGKTTLLLLAAGLLRCDFGSVRFEGRDLGALSKKEVLEYRRTALGFVFQNYNLVQGLSAEENVALPLLLRGVDHRKASEQALAALKDVGLLRRAQHSPAQLSGGEQQRISVARALVGAPKLVLADEPTGNLDSDTGDVVLELLGRLSRERSVAVMLVTHDSRIAEQADRVLTIRDGRLAQESEPAARAAGV